MDVFMEWITQIIIFLLLAMIVDLLIPANSMKKYIHFVVGLILIVVFLKPVFYLFHMDIRNAVERSQINDLFDLHSEETLKKKIEIQKSEIESSQHAYILEQMAVQLKDLADTPLKEEFNVSIVAIDFNFHSVDDYTYENLEEVIIVINDSDNREGSVHEVDEIVIDTKQTSVIDEIKNEDDIKQRLQEIWQIDDKQLTIMWEGE